MCCIHKISLQYLPLYINTLYHKHDIPEEKYLYVLLFSLLFLNIPVHEVPYVATVQIKSTVFQLIIVTSIYFICLKNSWL